MHNNDHARRCSYFWLLVCGVWWMCEVRAEDGARVEVAKAEQRVLVEEVPLTGSVSSPQIALLSSEVAGLVSRVHVDAGDVVEAGDVLLELNNELGTIDRDSARAAARGAHATREESRKRLADARRLEVTRAIAANEVRALEAQVEVDEAAWRAADADARRQEAELNRHRLIAPFKATVSRKLTEVGEWLTPGSGVMELVATEGLRVDFQVPQQFYPRVDESSAMVIQFDAYPDQTFPGKIHRKVPLSDNGARTFLLRVLLDESTTEQLIPGMSVRATLQLTVAREGVVVPRDALLRYPDGRVSVWVLSGPAENNTAQVREQRVTTGLGFGEWIEIRTGLDAGALVIVRGNEALREGQTVTFSNLESE